MIVNCIKYNKNIFFENVCIDRVKDVSLGYIGHIVVMMADNRTEQVEQLLESKMIITVNEVPLVGTETVYEVLGQFTEELDTMYPEIEQLGEQKIVKSGGMEWAVQNYVNESEGSAVYMSYSISIWQDQAYLIICSSSQEAQLDDNGLKKDIMGSLRPAT